MVTAREMSRYLIVMLALVVLILSSAAREDGSKTSYINSSTEKRFSTTLPSSESVYIIQPVYNTEALISLKDCHPKKQDKNQGGFCQ